MSIILQIIVKEWDCGFKEKSQADYTKDLISHLNNSMRHIADDWEINEHSKKYNFFLECRFYKRKTCPITNQCYYGDCKHLREKIKREYPIMEREANIQHEIAMEEIRQIEGK